MNPIQFLHTCIGWKRFLKDYDQIPPGYQGPILRRNKENFPETQRFGLGLSNGPNRGGTIYLKMGRDLASEMLCSMFYNVGRWKRPRNSVTISVIYCRQNNL
jgi:hypothetical protein